MNIVSLFRRSTNSKYFLPEIDGLRFFAIITVMIYHMNTSYVRHLGYSYAEWKEFVGVGSFSESGWWLIRMDIGVKVFFAISGFILALPFLKQYMYNGNKVILKDYFYRRLTRLEPPFVITLIIFSLVHIVMLHEGVREILPHFLSGLIYGHVFIFGESNPVNPVTWSLETEAQFYIILPFIMILLFSIRNAFLKIIFIALLLALSIYAKGYFLTHHITHLESSILAFFTNFAMGIFFAVFFLRYGSQFFKKKNLLFDLLGIVSVFVMFYFYKPQAVWYNNVLLNLSVLGLFFSVFKGTVSNWFYTRPVIYIIGGMCYSLYLLHYAFFYLIVKYTGNFKTHINYWTDLGLQVLLMLPLFLIVGSVFYLLIEKPCMDKNWPQNLYIFIKSKILNRKS